eukprot:11737593-Ditylum_brightwellii.AAC.1
MMKASILRIKGGFTSSSMGCIIMEGVRMGVTGARTSSEALFWWLLENLIVGNIGHDSGEGGVIFSTCFGIVCFDAGGGGVRDVVIIGSGNGEEGVGSALIVGGSVPGRVGAMATLVLGRKKSRCCQSHWQWLI